MLDSKKNFISQMLLRLERVGVGGKFVHKDEIIYYIYISWNHARRFHFPPTYINYVYSAVEDEEKHLEEIIFAFAVGNKFKNKKSFGAAIVKQIFVPLYTNLFDNAAQCDARY